MINKDKYVFKQTNKNKQISGNLPFTVKALRIPPRGLFNFGHSRGGLYKEEEEKGTKSNVRLYMIAIQFFHPIFCRFNIQFYKSNI